MSIAPDSVITQVAPEQSDNILLDMYDVPQDDVNTVINLNIRGQLFTITRDELMALPESILLCLFPNGVFVDIDGNVISNLTEEDVVYVNFAPECFQYIVDTFGEAAAQLPPQPDNSYYDRTDAELLQEKPAIIVLREDLDYYCIPPIHGLTAEDMKLIKIKTGDYLSNNQKVFDGLGYKPGKTLGPAEQHLLDMLCSSGFNVDSNWGHRSREPDRAIVSSLALVRLNHPKPDAENDSELSTMKSGQSLTTSVTSLPSERSRSRSRIASLARSASSRSRSKKRENSVATKLLLFWRKPARKCWWSNEVYDIELLDISFTDPATNQVVTKDLKFKVHIRRVWTLELSVVGVQ